MKKRVLAIAMTLAMTLSLLPVSALATEGDQSAANDETLNEDVGVGGPGIGYVVQGVHDNYLTIAEALEADETNLKLIDDITLESSDWGLTEGVDLTIDLNGFEITMEDDQTVIIPEGASLTLSNGTIMANEYPNGTKAVFNAGKDASIVMDDITMETTGAALFPAGNAAAVTVTDSKITGGTYVVGTNASTQDDELIYSDDVKITLTDSEFDTTGYTNNDYDACTVMINVPGILTIDNCTIIGHRQAVLVRGGTADIRNSTITMDADLYSGSAANSYFDGDWKSGNEVPMGALVVGNRSSAYKFPASCTLTDTTVEVSETSGLCALYAYGMESEAGVDRSVSVAISGDRGGLTGKFSSEGLAELTIAGGHYSDEVDKEYLAANYECIGNEENGYIVQKMENKLVVDGSVSEVGGETTVNGKLEGSFSETGSIEDQTGEGIGDGEGSTTPATRDVTVDLTTSAEETTATTTTLNVTAGTAQSLAQAESLTVQTDVGNVSFNSTALNNMSTDDASDVVITVTKNTTVSTGDVKASYTVSAATETGTNLLPFNRADTNGTVTIQVLVPEDGKAASDYQAWYVTGQSDSLVYVERLPISERIQVEGYVTFQIKHLSTVVLRSAGDEITGAEATVTKNGETTAYPTLADAIKQAKSGDTITLLTDVTASNASLTDPNVGVYVIPNGVTLDGNHKKITASESWIQAGNAGTSNHILSVESNGTAADQTTIKNLTIIGLNAETQKTKAGINAYNGANVLLENVDIQNCGSVGIQVNGAEVTTKDVTISGSGWGGINVDSKVSSDSKLTVETTTITDAFSIYVESTGSVGTPKQEVIVNSGSFQNITARNTTKSNDTITINGGTVGNVTNAGAGGVDIEGGTITNVTNSGSGRTEIEGGQVTGNVEITPASGDCLLIYKVDGVIVYARSMGNAGSGTVDMGYTETPTKPGYTFTYWTCDKGGVTLKNVGGIYKWNGVQAGETYTFTAQWAKNQTSDPDRPSGSGSSSSDSGDYLITVDRVSGGRVTVQPGRADKGDTVTITVYPNDGYELDELVVTDSRGNEIDLDARSATRFTFTMPSGKVTVEASFVREGGQTQTPQTTFADVPASAWYCDAVEYVYENGLMSGVSGGRFAPNDTLTRAMLVQTLYAMEGRPAAASAGFADVASGDWYASAVNWAAANGVVSGVSETGFGPNNALTREQLALILYRFAQYKGYDVTGTSDLAAYADGSSVSGWAAEAMSWAVDAGLISGVGGNQIAPTGTASRAQVAQILMNFCENVAR